ncbi:MAG TPA: DUF1592 domain-containing protein [Polyangiaceae bacterium]|nr:DUF1592 domain-containing protein [Polyangiaceae bacterium]
MPSLGFGSGRALLGCVLLLAGTACGPKLTRAPAQADAQTRALLPARLRLLSVAELESSVEAVVGKRPDLAARLAPDVRQSGYTRNAGQSWSGTNALRWNDIVENLAREVAEQDSARLWSCATNDSACSTRQMGALALRAWRRPATAAELEQLARIYDLGRANADRHKALALLLQALFQAPSFLYASELGIGIEGDRALTKLDDYEIGSALAYTLSGAPPDEQLLDAARLGTLVDADERVRHAWRILGKSETRFHFRRFVLEWLEVDRLQDSVKDAASYPNYDALKSKMLEETANFSDQVIVEHGASVQALLDAGFASVDPSMARFYGLPAYGVEVPLSATARRGVLQQASVLAAHSHPDITSPVKRGDFVLRRVLCEQLKRPAELGIEVVMPRPVADQTGRERLRAHDMSLGCASCHKHIDPLGFVFENFDTDGQVRKLDAGKPVDTSVDWAFQGQVHHFANSVELSRWLASRPETGECFARQAFRYFSAQTDAAAEDEFLNQVARLPTGEQNNLVQMLVAYVASDSFVLRRQK